MNIRINIIHNFDQKDVYICYLSIFVGNLWLFPNFINTKTTNMIKMISS